MKIKKIILSCRRSFITFQRQRKVKASASHDCERVIVLTSGWTSTLITCSCQGVTFILIVICPPVPCAPQNVSAVKECGADSIVMTWKSVSAIFYVAIAMDSNGVIHSCNSMQLTCEIEGLRCSTNYTAYVIASNFLCNSSKSEMIIIETGTMRLLVSYLTHTEKEKHASSI